MAFHGVLGTAWRWRALSFALATLSTAHAFAQTEASPGGASPMDEAAATEPPSTEPAPADTSASPPPEPAAPAPAPAPPPAPLGPTAPRPPGTIELRIQTVSNVAGAGQLALTAAPGFAYDPDSGTYVINVVGGAGYFLNPYFALGLDASYTRAGGGNLDATLVAVAPFAKFVTGQDRFRPGFFAELSPGWVLLDSEETSHHLQLSGWLGAHVPLSRWVALAFGPSTIFIAPLEGNADSVYLIGFRIGLSAYLP